MTLAFRRHRGQTLSLVAVAAFATLAARPLSAQSRPAPERLDTAAILSSARPEIEAANAAWLPGLRRHDATSIAAVYADSGLFITADGAVVRGRTAIANMYAARFRHQREIRAGGVVHDGFAVVGAARVYEWGHAWLEMAADTPTKPPVRSGGAYLTVWQRESDGHWRIVRNLTF